jgi:hypothetical protein
LQYSAVQDQRKLHGLTTDFLATQIHVVRALRQILNQLDF